MPRFTLAPLDPDRFLAWVWRQEPDEVRGPEALTTLDIAVEKGEPVAWARRALLHIAARVRANQRIGHDPWEGIPRP